MRFPLLRSSVVAGLLCVLAVLSGCVTAEVKSASAALETARTAGKATECPAQFAEAEDLVKRAELLCNQCKPSEANALAAEAMGKIQALCPAKVVAAPPPAPAPAPAPVQTPSPPAAPAATVSLSASPASITEGGCSTLTWSSTGATSIRIDPEPGTVPPNGSKQVCPSATTRYNATASGPGASATASETVSVKPKPTETLTVHVNFDTNKYVIRKADVAELDKLEAFVRRHQACRFEVNGYTDSTGPEDFNQGLSERRADALKAYIISKGGAADRVTAAGHGESNPVGDNSTAEGRFENRRAEVEAYCQ
jgi:outer membrane protein OmpA-like peptidoglycan-associated protein